LQLCCGLWVLRAGLDKHFSMCGWHVWRFG
jgi:hypothetical protein